MTKTDSATLGDLLDLPEAAHLETVAFLKESSQFQYDGRALAEVLLDSVALKATLTAKLMQ